MLTECDTTEPSLAARIVRAMEQKKFPLDKDDGEINIVYIEGMNPDGSPNKNELTSSMICATLSGSLAACPTADSSRQVDVSYIAEELARLGQAVEAARQSPIADAVAEASAATPLSPVDKALGGQAMVGLKTPLAIVAYAGMWIMQAFGAIGPATGADATTRIATQPPGPKANVIAFSHEPRLPNWEHAGFACSWLVDFAVAYLIATPSGLGLPRFESCRGDVQSQLG